MIKQTTITGILIITLVISGCTEQTNKNHTPYNILGTWQIAEGGSITFSDNTSATIHDIEIFIEIGFIDTETKDELQYTIEDNQITFSDGTKTLIFILTYHNENTLSLTDETGQEFIFEKQ